MNERDQRLLFSSVGIKDFFSNQIKFCDFCIMTKHNQSVIKVFQYRESKSENKSLKDVSVKSPGYGLEDLMSVSSGTVGPGE